MRSAAASACASSRSSSLTKMRSAWNVRVAGWMSPGAHAHDARQRYRRAPAWCGSAPRCAPRDDCARHRAGVALLAQRRDDGGKIALGQLRRPRRRRWPGRAHAHVERAVEPERKAALGLVELHRRDAEVEHDAVDGVDARARERPDSSVGETVLNQASRPAGRLDQMRRRARPRPGRDRCRSRGTSAAARIRRVWPPAPKVASR